MSDLELKSQYFQSIARFILETRKAPFFLSPEEMDLIDRWQKKGIPLRVVLEGLKTAYELYKQKSSGSHRPFNLKYARNFVYRAFASHRDRRVGKKREKEDDSSREGAIRAAKKFLVSCPSELEELKRLFQKALKLLSKPEGEELLEEMDEKVDVILLNKATEADKTEAEDEVRRKFSPKNAGEFSSLLSLVLKKNLREKYRVPYLSPYLYSFLVFFSLFGLFG